jgi:tetratricopeptide (TPR) repeat protein
LIEKPGEILKTVVEPGTTEKRLEEWQDAAKLLEWASEMRPADNQVAAKAAYCKGRVNYLTEQKDAAVENWKKAADLDKKWALPLNGIGLIYNERKDYEGARKWLLQAIEREPNWAIPYNNLGSSYFFQKRFSEAAPYYQKALAISPRWARPHAWLASIAMENYDYQTAVEEFEKVLAPDAVGASELNLESIRKQLEKARSMASYNYGY